MTSAQRHVHRVVWFVLPVMFAVMFGYAHLLADGASSISEGPMPSSEHQEGAAPHKHDAQHHHQGHQP